MRNYLRQVSKTTAILVIAISAIKVNAQEKFIPIETRDNAIVLQVTKDQYVNIVYFGKKLADKNDYQHTTNYFPLDGNGVFNQAYTTTTRNLFEPAIAVTNSDGNKTIDLKYVDHSVNKISDNVSEVQVKLKDPVYAIDVTLLYKIYADENVIEQWSVIEHHEKGNITLNKYASANLLVRAKSYWLKQYHGNWAEEMRPEESQLTHGIKTLDSKLGARANYFQPPSFIIALDKPVAEDEGDVLIGNLEWSGNFRVDMEVDPTNNLKLLAGINNYASDYSLKPNTLFETPKLVYTLAHHGAGEGSRNLQSWARKYKIVDGMGSRLTLLNNWESTYFNFNEAKLSELLKDTKKLGVDLFLLDDGWFGNKYPRNDDHAGLGDWQVNKAKLPNGIAHLVQEAQTNGVKFGIWVEPEMVNPKSELYEKHPDWVVKQPKRDDFTMRNQFVLDLSNPKVQDFVFNTVDGLFVQNPGLAYIKWDCNAVMYNAYSAYQKDQSNFYVDYVKGLYKVLEKLRAKYPKVPMMLCSGGGGRIDYGALQYFTEYWPSDDTEPIERVFIQWEYSYLYPAIASSNHVTDWGKQPIKFRVDVAMMGKLGFDIVVSKLSADELAFCQQAIQNYKAYSDAIWHGEQYRLQSPWDNDAASVMYMDAAKSKGIMFNYLVNNRYNTGTPAPIKLKGLDAAKKYSIKEINMFGNAKSTVKEGTYSGDFLMNVGINPEVKEWRKSVVLVIDEVK